MINNARGGQSTHAGMTEQQLGVGGGVVVMVVVVINTGVVWLCKYDIGETFSCKVIVLF